MWNADDTAHKVGLPKIKRAALRNVNKINRIVDAEHMPSSSWLGGAKRSMRECPVTMRL